MKVLCPSHFDTPIKCVPPTTGGSRRYAGGRRRTPRVAGAVSVAGWLAGKVPKFDFVPSQAAPAYFTTEHLVGAVAPSEFEGLQVLGSYGDAWLIESHYAPSEYVIVAAIGGLDSDRNPIGFREHVNPASQGLRHIPGRGPYPWRNSFDARGFGIGVPHRGTAVVIQVTTNGSYTAPIIQT